MDDTVPMARMIDMANPAKYSRPYLNPAKPQNIKVEQQPSYLIAACHMFVQALILAFVLVCILGTK